jgi:hypothetical protein
MTTTVRNARDKILQAATVRTEPVVLPPTVIVPPSQLGAGSLPGTVTGSDGTTIVHQGNFRAQTVVADQVDTRGLTIKDATGNVIFSAGVPLSSGRISGLGALASANVVNLATQAVGQLNGATQVTNLGQLAYANVVTAEAIVAGSFTGKVFTGGEFQGTTFKGINMSTENLYVNSVNATDELKAFNVTAIGTSTITNLVVGKDIFAPNAIINTLNLAATNDVRTVNLYATSSASLPSGTFVNGGLSAGSFSTSGQVSAGSLSVNGSVTLGSLTAGAINTNGSSISAGSISSSWDLSCQNLYAHSTVGGAGFNGFVRTGNTYNVTINGQSGTISF